MKIDKIYISSNGDIILKYDCKSLMKEVDPAEFALIMAKATNMLYDGNTEFAMAKNNIINGTEHTAYYDASGNLIGVSEVTIPYQYDNYHDMFFLRHMSTNPFFK